MKLKINEFEKLAREQDYACGYDLWICMDGGDDAYHQLQKGNCGIGYEMVRKIYNTFGEAETVRVVDFEEDTIEGLKSKYIKLDKTLIGVADNDDNTTNDLRELVLDEELIYLFEHEESKHIVYPEWYFTSKCFTIHRRGFTAWKNRSGLSWGEIAMELGIGRSELMRKQSGKWRWTMMDLICLIELMGAKELFGILFFPSIKLREEIKRRIFENEKGGQK